MAQDKTAEQTAATEPSAPASTPFLSKKMLLIGIPVVLVEAVMVYFLTAMFIVPKISSAGEETEKPEKAAVVIPEPQVFVVNDLIVNPAGTNGTRFLLTTIGFEVSTPEAKAELERKELQVRDMLNSVLMSKGLDSLIDVRCREVLRREITERVGHFLTTGKTDQVYFSKFIVQ
jgi:flagellar protein FliL